MSRLTLVCVDADKTALTALRHQLNASYPDCQVETAERGSEGLELLHQLKQQQVEIPLLIVGQNLAEMTAEVFLNHANALDSKIPKLLLANSVDPDLINQLVETVDLYQYLVKPWSESDLRLTIRTAIKLHYQEQKLAKQAQVLETVWGELLEVKASIQQQTVRAQQVEQAVSEQQRVEAELQVLNDTLEEQIRQRTSELEQTVQQLQQEIQQRQQSEQALQQAYQILNLHIENSPLAVIEWDANLSVKRWSPRAEEIFGWTAEDVIGLPCGGWRFIAEEDVELVQASTERLCSGVTAQECMQSRNYTKTGAIVYSEWYNSALQDEEGNLVSILSLVQDITDRKRFEAALRASEAKLNSILSNAIAAISCCRIFPNRDWQYEYYSAGAEAIFGYTPEELVADQSLWRSRIPIEDWVSIILPAYDQILTGHPVKVEYQFRHKDGRIRWIAEAILPQWEAATQSWMMTAVAIDISDRRRIEAQLRDSQERFVLATTQSLVGVWDWNLEANTFYLSPNLKAMLGYADDEIPNDLERWSGLIHPEDRAATLTAAQAYLDGLTPVYEMSHRMIHKDGSIRWILVRGTAFRDQSGKPYRMAGTDTDITELKQAEAALRASELQLRQITDAIPGAVYQCRLTRQGAFEFPFMSQGILDLYGVSAEEIQQTPQIMFERLFTEDVEAFVTSVQHSATTLSLWEQEFRVHIADCGLRWISGRAVPNVEPDGSILWNGILIDISDRKQAELELAQNRDLREAIYNESTDALFLIDPETLLTVDCNDRAVELFEANSKSALVNVEGHTLLTPEELAAVTQEMQHHGFWSRELEYVTVTGRHFWANLAARQIQVAGKPLNLVRLTDITKRKKTEERLLLLESVAVHSNDAVVITEAEPFALPGPRILYVNAAFTRLTGYQPEEVIGQTPRILQGPKTDRATLDQIRTALEAWQPIVVELVNYRKDGSEFWVENSITPVADKTGYFTHWIAVQRDITERKRAEEALAQKAEELARSNAELQHFAQVASHDLQEPLRKIQAFGDRLQTKLGPVIDAEGRDYLQRMQNAAGRMQTLIDGLLSLSRVTTKAQPFVPVNLTEIAQAVLSDLEIRLEQSGGQVELGPLPTLEADPLQMRQLLQNLIGNALKFHAPDVKPIVKITSHPISSPLDPALKQSLVQEWYEIQVSDNGIGFDQKYLDRIFKVFQRLHSHTAYPGTGIGLAICRKIVERHGGSITANSEPNRGATFRVVLPARQP